MNDTEKYILDSIKVWVWSGFYAAEEVQEMISDILEDEVDEDMLRASVGAEFRAKRSAEMSWPDVTDCHRLDDAFRRLDSEGILCLHNAGYTMSDGHEDAFERLSSSPQGKYWGYCFYHGQDLERAVQGNGLALAFDHIDGDVPDKVHVAERIIEILANAGLKPEWNGSPEKRIQIPRFDWKKKA